MVPSPASHERGETQMGDTFNATFKQLTIKGDATITLTLDPHDMHMLPTLAKLAGQPVLVGIAPAQQAIDFDGYDE